MSRCDGFEHGLSFDDDHTTSKKQKALPCHPSTVVYGHAASRGLDIKRWTVGLDSGCVSIFPTIVLLVFIAHRAIQGIRPQALHVQAHSIE